MSPKLLKSVAAGLLPVIGLAGTVGTAHAAGNFPPFDSTTYAGQLFWLALSFGALYWLMSTIALPRIGETLATRADRIAKDLDDAAAMKAKAEDAVEAYEKSLAAARAKSNEIAQARRQEVAQASDARRKAKEQELAAKIEASEATIAGKKAEAMSNVRGLSLDVARAIVARLTDRTPDEGKVSAAVDSVLKGA